MDIKSKMPGKILELKVKTGDAVKRGDILAVMEAMKMKNPIPCPADGTVKDVKVEVNSRVNAGDILVVVE